MNIVFDLDGTLADTAHRQHFLDREEKDWDGFFEACSEDTPIVPLIKTLMSLGYQEHRVEIWTGRGTGNDNSVRNKTQAWLQKNTTGLSFIMYPEAVFFQPKLSGIISVRMRDYDDYTQDTKLKARWLYESRKQGQDVDLVFEDRNSVVAMWRSKGVMCCHVADAPF